MIETVVMHMEQESVQEYVVETDPGAVARMRASLLRTLPVSAWAGVVATVFTILVVGGTLFFLSSTGTDFTRGTNVLSLMSVLLWLCLVPLWLYEAKRRFAVLRRLKQTWAAKEISSVAMRMSPDGLTCVIDAAPEDVFLPWAAVTHVRTKGRGRFIVLRVALASGAATTPGATGLDQPEVRSRTRRSLKGVSRLHLAVFPLRRPVGEAEIDQALGHFSGGRVRIR